MTTKQPNEDYSDLPSPPPGVELVSVDEFTKRLLTKIFTQHDNGLVIHGQPTIEECQRYWDQTLIPVKRAFMFQIGDLLCWIEDTYGDEWASLIDYFDIDESNVRKARRVCRRFPITDRRVPPLSFTHYDAVCKLDDEAAGELLALAEKHRWGRDALREAVKAHVGEEAGDTSADTVPALARIILPFQRLADVTPDELGDLTSGAALLIRDGRHTVGVLLSEDNFERMV